MKRKDIINELKKYFSYKELVCKHVSANFSETMCWTFLTYQYLMTLLVLRRDIFRAPMICNNYSFKVPGGFSERGLRCNCCVETKKRSAKNKPYMSAHNTGNGGDWTVKGMTAEQARQLIIKNQDKLPYAVRMESGVNWLHIDVYNTGNGKKVTLFKA